jgi:CubicO group peptidase (beta-lactamase class C family)
LETGRVPGYAEAIAVKPTAAPGEKFSYGPVPFQVFGEILRRKLAKQDDAVMGYLGRKILGPLGIKPDRWRKDGAGNPNLPSGAALTARDWAKFGEMVRLDGKGVLPAGRLAECFHGTKVNPGYGLTWWLPGQGPLGGNVPRKIAGPWLPKETRLAAGAGGQRLVVIPSLKLVAVRLAPVRGGEGAFDDRGWLRALLEPLTTEAGISRAKVSP